MRPDRVGGGSAKLVHDGLHRENWQSATPWIRAYWELRKTAEGAVEQRRNGRRTKPCGLASKPLGSSARAGRTVDRIQRPIEHWPAEAWRSGERPPSRKEFPAARKTALVSKCQGVHSGRLVDGGAAGNRDRGGGAPLGVQAVALMAAWPLHPHRLLPTAFDRDGGIHGWHRRHRCAQ